MAYTQADIDALEAKIKEGVRRVRFTDREVEFRSIEEMERTLAMMRQQLASPPRTTFFPRVTKGLDQ